MVCLFPTAVRVFHYHRKVEFKSRRLVVNENVNAISDFDERTLRRRPSIGGNRHLNHTIQLLAGLNEGALRRDVFLRHILSVILCPINMFLDESGFDFDWETSFVGYVERYRNEIAFWS